MPRTRKTTRPTESSGKALKVKIVVGVNHIALIDPPVREVMLLLTDHVRTFVAGGGPTGYSCVEESLTLGGFDHRERVGFSAGLLPRVLALLDEYGADVEVDDRRELPPWLAVEKDTLNELDPQQRVLVEAVLREPLGRIELENARAAVDVCRLFCNAFSRARILIAVATAEQVVNLRKTLGSRHGERVGLAVPGVRLVGKIPRLLVSTFGSAPRRTAGKWDVLLLPCGEDATGDRAVESIVWMDFPRIYACVRPTPCSDRLVRLRLEQIAGPVVHELDRPEAAVNVVVVPNTVGAVAGAATALELKRQLYWRNHARNETVADVSEAVVAED